MNTDFRLPYVTAKDTDGRVRQIQSYMYQLVEQLNHAMGEVERQQEEFQEIQKSTISAIESPEAVENTFTQIKELIIKSADIVEAYTEQISIALEGKYVAISDYGEYQNDVSALFTAMASQIALMFSDIQSINTTLNVDDEGQNVTVVSTNAYIRTGRLEDSVPPVYGIEVGQTSTAGEQQLFSKYARFTPSGIYFYLEGDTPVASFENDTMHISYAQIDFGMRLGGYIVDATNGIAFKWAT